MQLLHVNGRAARRGERGASLVEMAVVLPVLALLLVGAIDFGRVFYVSMALTNAARVGVQYGAQNPGTAVDTAGMRAAAIAAARPDIGTITAAATRTCSCNGGARSSAACTAACASPSIIRTYVTVQTAMPSLSPFATVSRLFPFSSTLSRTVVMRVAE